MLKAQQLASSSCYGHGNASAHHWSVVSGVLKCGDAVAGDCGCDRKGFLIGVVAAGM